MIHVVKFFKALIHRMRHESNLNDLEEAFGDRKWVISQALKRVWEIVSTKLRL